MNPICAHLRRTVRTRADLGGRIRPGSSGDSGVETRRSGRRPTRSQWVSGHGPGGRSHTRSDPRTHSPSEGKRSEIGRPGDAAMESILVCPHRGSGERGAAGVGIRAETVVDIRRELDRDPTLGRRPRRGRHQQPGRRRGRHSRSQENSRCRTEAGCPIGSTKGRRRAIAEVARGRGAASRFQEFVEGVGEPIVHVAVRREHGVTVTSSLQDLVTASPYGWYVDGSPGDVLTHHPDVLQGSLREAHNSLRLPELDPTVLIRLPSVSMPARYAARIRGDSGERAGDGCRAGGTRKADTSLRR